MSEDPRRMAEEVTAPELYENHPFRKDLPSINYIYYIHYEQSEGLVMLVSKECLLFFAVSWANLEFLGGHLIPQLRHSEDLIRGI